MSGWVWVCMSPPSAVCVHVSALSMWVSSSSSSPSYQRWRVFRPGVVVLASASEDPHGLSLPAIPVSNFTSVSCRHCHCGECYAYRCLRRRHCDRHGVYDGRRCDVVWCGICVIVVVAVSMWHRRCHHSQLQPCGLVCLCCCRRRQPPSTSTNVVLRV